MNNTTLIVAAVTLLFGFAAGYLLQPAGTPSGIPDGEPKPLYYRSPMNPSVTSPTPAKDAMGMDYVPVFSDGDAAPGHPGTITIDPTVIQSIGVRTDVAVRKTFGRSVRAVGRIDFNEQRISRLHPKVEGWIEDIYVDRTGEPVANDQQLLSLYSPKLVSSQQEYLLALKNLALLEQSPHEEIRLGAQQLASSARERLALLDVPGHQIRELESSRRISKDLHIHAPQAGTVIRIGARKGQYVTPKTELYFIVDLQDVWVYADIYDYELPWIRAGDHVSMTLASVPGTTFQGTVDYIYPYAESTTRTTKVRMIFDNPELLLRPDMFADVVIHASAEANAIVVPSEAIVRSGSAPRVYVQKPGGKFEPREVVLGIESGGEIAILEGLEAGEEVVTSAQFLVDSESKLKEATSKMLDAMSGKAGDAQHTEGGHDGEHEG